MKLGTEGRNRAFCLDHFAGSKMERTKCAHQGESQGWLSLTNFVSDFLQAVNDGTEGRNPIFF